MDQDPVETPSNQKKEENKNNQANSKSKPPKKAQTVFKPVFDSRVPYEDIRKIKNHESLLRMKFLTEAALEYRDLAPNLSWHFLNEMNQVGEKTVIRIHNTTKKFICKRCKGPIDRSFNIDERPKFKKICKLKFYEKACAHCGAKTKTFLKSKPKPKPRTQEGPQ